MGALGWQGKVRGNGCDFRVPGENLYQAVRLHYIHSLLGSPSGSPCVAMPVIRQEVKRDGAVFGWIALTILTATLL